MIVKELPTFSAWIRALRDPIAKMQIAARITRLSFGLVGDVKAVGEGVFELRIHVGAGYGVYYVIRGDETILLLIGGDKKTQKKDIEKAKMLAREHT